MTSTLTITAMIFATIITASVFALVFRGLGGDEHVEALLAVLPGGADGALLFVMALIFLLGCFLDFVELSVLLLSSEARRVGTSVSVRLDLGGRRLLTKQTRLQIH